MNKISLVNQCRLQIFSTSAGTHHGAGVGLAHGIGVAEGESVVLGGGG